MLVFNKTLDIRTRQVTPQVAVIYFSPNNPLYCIVGTEYGHIHSPNGSLRTWQSRSAARDFLKKYLGRLV